MSSSFRLTGTLRETIQSKIDTYQCFRPGFVRRRCNETGGKLQPEQWTIASNRQLLVMSRLAHPAVAAFGCAAVPAKSIRESVRRFENIQFLSGFPWDANFCDCLSFVNSAPFAFADLPIDLVSSCSRMAVIATVAVFA